MASSAAALVTADRYQAPGADEEPEAQCDMRHALLQLVAAEVGCLEVAFEGRDRAECGLGS